MNQGEPTLSNYAYDDAPAPRRRRKKHPVRTTVLLMLGLVLTAALVAGGYLFNLAHTYNTQTQTIENAFPEESTRPTRAATAEGSLNVLLIGSDESGGSGETEDPAEVPNAGRSDTMMLVHLPADRENVYVMSIMRDTWTDIPGYGEHKINSAMSFGGVPLVVQTRGSHRF